MPYAVMKQISNKEYMTKGRQQKADAPKRHPNMPLDQSGQPDGQLIQIGDVQEGITIKYWPLSSMTKHVL